MRSERKRIRESINQIKYTKDLGDVLIDRGSDRETETKRGKQKVSRFDLTKRDLEKRERETSSSRISDLDGVKKKP